MALLAAVSAGTASAQSPLVQNPQAGATPPVPAAARAPSPLPAVPIVAPVQAMPTVPQLRAAPHGPPRQPLQQREPGGLPAPNADPLRVDPARDPILQLARAESSLPEFRAAIAAAIVRNPAFDEAIAQRAEAVAARNEARARQYPAADLNFSTFRVVDREFSNDPGNVLERQRPNRRTDITLRVSQPILDFGVSSARVRAGNERLLAAAAGVEDAGTQLALRAVAAWYNVYGYRTILRLAEAFAASQRELRGQTEARIRQGVAAAGDLAQVDSYIASADTQVADFRRSVAGAEAQFAAVTGSAPPTDLGRAPVPDLSVVDRAALTGAVDALPAVRAARAAAAATRQDQRVAEAELLPQLGVGLDAGRYGVVETSGDYDVRANVTLSWRLGGGATQRVGQARARADSADARVRRTADDAARDAEIAWADVAALTAARDSIEANYLASRTSRDVLAERFRVSRGTLFDVIGAQSNFFAVAARYIQTVTELDIARYVLLARTGRLLPALGIEPAQWDRR